MGPVIRREPTIGSDEPQLLVDNNVNKSAASASPCVTVEIQTTWTMAPSPAVSGL